MCTGQQSSLRQGQQSSLQLGQQSKLFRASDQRERATKEGIGRECQEMFRIGVCVRGIEHRRENSQKGLVDFSARKRVCAGWGKGLVQRQ